MSSQSSSTQPGLQPLQQISKTYNVRFALAPLRTGSLTKTLTIADIHNGAIKRSYKIDIDESAFTREEKRDNICTHLEQTGVCKTGGCYIGYFPAGCSLAWELYGGKASQSYWSQNKGIVQDENMRGAKLYYVEGLKVWKVVWGLSIRTQRANSRDAVILENNRHANEYASTLVLW